MFLCDECHMVKELLDCRWSPIEAGKKLGQNLGILGGRMVKIGYTRSAGWWRNQVGESGSYYVRHALSVSFVIGVVFRDCCIISKCIKSALEFKRNYRRREPLQNDTSTFFPTRKNS